MSGLAHTLGKPPARPVRVLARRPVAFYLLVYAGTPFVLEPALEQFRQGRQGDLALIDEAVLGAGVDLRSSFLDQDRSVSEGRLANWYEPITSLVLDPVTLLDTDPEAVLHQRHRNRTVHFWDLIWSGDPQTPSDRGAR